MWDAHQYERFRGERARPFFDLLSRIPDRSYRSIADLGCGTGDLTAALADHWPEARVTGVDLSEEMLARAMERAGEQLDFVQGDIASWRPQGTAELTVSNAAFQWVPDQPALLRHVTSYMPPQSVLAVQIPASFQTPSHTLIEETAAEAPWAEKLTSRRRCDHVSSLSTYVDLLWSEGLQVDAWETVYHHVLGGDDAVLEWMKGTALRPILAALGDGERGEFLAACGAKLRKAYPPSAHGTILPFRRIFFVARKP